MSIFFQIDAISFKFPPKKLLEESFRQLLFFVSATGTRAACAAVRAACAAVRAACAADRAVRADRGARVV